jgi:hypothetical protein
MVFKLGIEAQKHWRRLNGSELIPKVVIGSSWETLRSQLSTHQVVTVRLPTIDGRVLTIRRDTRPEQIHRDIYRVLRVPERILSPIRRWTQNSH